MAFSTSAIQPQSKPVTEKTIDNVAAASLLSMLVLSVYAAQKSRRSMRKMKRRFLWTAFKLKMKSMLSGKKAVSDRVLIYILLGVIALVLVFYYPLAALIVALLALILILAGVI